MKQDFIPWTTFLVWRVQMVPTKAHLGIKHVYLVHRAKQQLGLEVQTLDIALSVSLNKMYRHLHNALNINTCEKETGT